PWDRGTPTALLDRLLSLWLIDARNRERVSWALATQLGTSRAMWTPRLSKSEIEVVRGVAERSQGSETEDDEQSEGAAALIGFHAGTVWGEGVLAERLNSTRDHIFMNEKHRHQMVDEMLRELGKAGQKYLRRHRRR